MFRFYFFVGTCMISISLPRFLLSRFHSLLPASLHCISPIVSLTLNRCQCLHVRLAGGDELSCFIDLAQRGMSALIRAASEGHTDCVRMLLEGGADKNIKNNVRVLDFAHFLYQCV
jgi:hypothetical protein